MLRSLQAWLGSDNEDIREQVCSHCCRLLQRLGELCVLEGGEEGSRGFSEAEVKRNQALLISLEAHTATGEERRDRV